MKDEDLSFCAELILDQGQCKAENTKKSPTTDRTEAHTRGDSVDPVVELTTLTNEP